MKKILVVEDEKDIQNIIKAFLENAEYKVETADDGLDAINFIQKNNYDLILLDIMLPKIDGFTVCEMIRKNSNIPIIILTALTDEESQLKGFDKLADDYITKPFSMPILLKHIEAIVITTPVIKISNISKKLSKLDMTWRCNTTRTDEIGVLANNLDTMAERLNKTINELTIANKQLQKDIEQEKEREKVQTQFFRAVSHELKTPLTIIKGQLEGMIYEVGEYKNKEKYLKHCLKVANDMESLIKEILSVAMIKEENFKLNEKEFNIANTIKNVLKKYQGIAEDKEIEIITNIGEQYNFIGDERLLENAISNIVSNAVMYSPKKEKVFIEFRNNKVKIENTGIHIESKDLEQLFNPFFRVDKSRNKNTGRSGLGLYIVKTIFDYHNISYKIENSQNGILFTIKLPE